MNITQKRIRKLAGMFLLLVLLTGMVSVPCTAAEETSEDVIIVIPDEGTDGTIDQPASFRAEAVKNGIRLSWQEVSGAQKYEIFRKICGADGGYELIKTTKKCTFNDKTAAYGVSYYYKARAVSELDRKSVV